MFRLVLILLITLLTAAVVDARNDTIVHGWVSEPQGRGTTSIVYSCLGTVLICTWSVLHLDVPKRHGKVYV